MKLTTRLLILVVAVMLVSSTASLFLVSANRQLTEAVTTSETIDQTVEGMVQLSILTSDYLISPSDRASSQWLSKHSSIIESLSLITVNDVEKQGLLQDALQELEKTQAIFTQLVETKQQSNSTESEVRQELDERLAGQISVELQRLLNISNNLKALNKADLDSAQRTSNLVGITLLVLLFAIILAFYITINVSILRPIFSLTQIAEDISQGKLIVEFPGMENQNEIGILSRTFRQMTNQLQETLAGLEQRVAERTKELEAAQETMTKRAIELQAVAEISTKASTATNVSEMLQTVVDLTKSSYSLYHTHIYLFDETKTKLVLASGAGEAGQIMVSEKRTIALDHPHSLVARAARTKQGAIANDVTKEPDFLPNPLLPDTKAEMAIPISIGDTVLGVLDVQADYINRFTDEDIAIKTTLAQQVATSLQNVQNFAQAQHQAERESMLNLIGQQIQSADSVEAVLQITARELSHALHSKDTRVILRDIASAGYPPSDQ
jgi:nitrate/nitrite-specific signal transduction histidine kinase